MNLWLVGLGLALFCTVNAESECSRDISKIIGKWCGSAVGSSDEHFRKHHHQAKLIMTEITITEENKAKISSNFPMKNGCKKIEMEFEKLEDGTYNHKSDWGEKNMKIVSTDCETYFLTEVKIQKKKKTSSIVVLYTKNCKLSDHLKEIFLEHARSLEIRDDQMKFPTEVACQNEA